MSSRNSDVVVAMHTYRLKNYDLVCSARPTDSGRYEPELVVAKHIWPSRPRTIAVRRGAHLTPETAIAAAHEQGIEWVENFG